MNALNWRRDVPVTSASLSDKIPNEVAIIETREIHQSTNFTSDCGNFEEVGTKQYL